MHLLGMTSGISDHRLPSDPFYFFAWESILPPDEVASLKSELREQWRIKEQRWEQDRIKMQMEDQERKEEQRRNQAQSDS